MARLPRICLPGISQHVVQRGNNQQKYFFSDYDYMVYENWLYEYSIKYHVSIHAWVLMTNHVHLLMTPETKDGISKLMQSLGRSYVRYFNSTYKRSGTLWEGRFKSCVVDAENYLLNCQQYIELNPVRAHIVKSPNEYKWSSFRSNGNGEPSRLWTPHAVYYALGTTMTERFQTYQEMFKERIDLVLLRRIRRSLNQELALGDDLFINKIELLSGRRVTAMKRGPRSKLTFEFTL